MSFTKIRWIFLTSVYSIFLLILPLDGAADTATRKLNQILATPANDFNMLLRITSRSNNRRPQISQLVIQGKSTAYSREYEIKSFNTNTTYKYCLACNNNYAVSACKNKALKTPESIDGNVPGTYLPWGEIIDGLCMKWSIKPLALNSDPVQNILVIRPAIRNRNLQWRYTHAYIDKATNYPVKLVRYQQNGQVLRNLDILEIRNMLSLIGIRRTYVTFANTRILIELRSFEYLDHEE